MPTVAPKLRPPACSQELLRAFLSAYWLRPENALWMTLRSATLAKQALASPTLDLCCGDGIFSFLHADGRFDAAFDVFGAVRDLERVTSAHADMFDAPGVDYQPAVAQRPRRGWDTGLDAKPNLLAKAGALGFYRTLIEHDCNAPLPFEPETFASVYCNALYWVGDVEACLAELRRVTRVGGRVVLQVKLAEMTDYTLEAFRDQLGERFLELIGRGRRACWPALATRAQWERRFRRAGFDLIDERPFVTRTHAHLWDIGLRPIAPLLVRMTQEIRPATRAAVKREWVALFLELLAPMCRPDFDLLDPDAEPAETQYTLTPG